MRKLYQRAILLNRPIGHLHDCVIWLHLPAFFSNCFSYSDFLPPLSIKENNQSLLLVTPSCKSAFGKVLHDYCFPENTREREKPKSAIYKVWYSRSSSPQSHLQLNAYFAVILLEYENATESNECIAWKCEENARWLKLFFLPDFRKS